MRGGYFRLQDGLSAFEDRHRLPIFVDVEVGWRQIRDRLTASRVDGEVDGNVGRPLHRAVDHLHIQPRAAQEERDRRQL